MLMIFIVILFLYQWCMPAKIKIPIPYRIITLQTLQRYIFLKIIHNFLPELIIRADENVPQYNPLILFHYNDTECIFNMFLYAHSVIYCNQKIMKKIWISLTGNYCMVSCFCCTLKLFHNQWCLNHLILTTFKISDEFKIVLKRKKKR